ncbi:spondin-1 isoform X2 [Pseudomyrmex gracilis]|uniref:spondin-1 isoform X2 n=1 Tax=Pseudomyrmex gracilis TaxID=219809 RepID=UPI0009949F1C|nr:spondin-1 isoform X2 [Pseudomyrmex gracilis]
MRLECALLYISRCCIAPKKTRHVDTRETKEREVAERERERVATLRNNVTTMYDTRIACYSVLLLLLAAVTSVNSTKCSRLIEGVTMSRSNAEGKFHFFLTLYNRTEQVYAYMPNTRYSVILKSDNSDQAHRKFRRFLISAEAENMNETADIGVFDLEDDTMTKFADNCPNTIVETSKIDKEEVSIIWKSPVEASGCVLLRATVVEAPNIWYMDDSNLVRTMCPDSKAEADDQGPVLDECCACDEAKYEVIFEAHWSRNTHPKDFPRGLSIRFSDVIGASHTGEYRFWQNNEMASIGLRQVAELGATRKLESELKDQSDKIRTIIKARGISYPNVTGKTFAVFRVDRKHHLMSLVSMIVPSPDWFIGVAGLELCLSNCTWITNKQLNLYPYDAGTDSGITYLSPDSPTDPQEPIRRITSTYPNDSGSPFYDPSGLDMKPLAKLYLNRQRLYEKTCENTIDPLADTEACKVTSWAEWGPCSVTCGTGTQLRQRQFYDEAAANANKCNTLVTDRKVCYNPQNPHCNGRRGGLVNTDKCKLSEWTDWSSCSSSCGEGSKTRSRNFRLRKYRKYCRAEPNGPQLQQSIDCENAPCNGEDPEEKCPKDRYSEWSMWSPCSSSCGPGVKLRSRLPMNKFWDKDDEECKVQQASCTAEILSCDFSKEDAEQICSEPMEKGHCNSNILRAYFDKQSGRCHLFSYSGCDGNRNNFPTEQDCNAVCGNFQRELRANQTAIMKNFKVSLSSVLSYHIPVQEQRRTKAKRAHEENFKGIQTGSQIIESIENKDCEMSEWSEWSECRSCRGFMISTRLVVSPSKGAGKSCPKKLFRKKKCNKRPECSLQRDGTRRRFHRDKNNEVENDVDCKVTQWSTWSKCSKTTCGEALQSRVRSIMVKPKGPWAKLCPALAELRKCPRTSNCPQ